MINEAAKGWMRAGAIAAMLAAATGCGYIGAPLPPALNIPVKITDLRGVQRGDKIILEFTPSLKATDGILLTRLSSIELKAGPPPEGPFDLNRWAEGATTIPVPDTSADPHEIEVPVAPWAGKTTVFGVRSFSPKGRPSQWSDVLILDVLPPLLTPVGLKADGAAQGVYVYWSRQGSAQGAQWRVFRQDEGQKDPVQLGIAGENSWMDRTAQFGATYSYSVQEIEKAGDKTAESEVTEPVSVKYEDKFAPAVPANLTAIGGVKTVEISWERSTEPDFKAYQVYRAEGDGPMVKLGAPVTNPSFSDTTVVSGKTYRYAVSAIDDKGNESGMCPAVEITAP